MLNGNEEYFQCQWDLLISFLGYGCGIWIPSLNWKGLIMVPGNIKVEFGQKNNCSQKHKSRSMGMKNTFSVNENY